VFEQRAGPAIHGRRTTWRQHHYIILSPNWQWLKAVAKSVLLPGIAEGRPGVSPYTQLAKPVLNDLSDSQETMQAVTVVCLQRNLDATCLQWHAARQVL